jgi:hypothetical protein
MVYSLTIKKYKTIIHSANTILTALLFCFFFTGIYKIFVLIIVLKGLLYLIRKKDEEVLNKPLKVLSTFTRVFLGILLPLAIVFFQNPIRDETIFISIIIGEAIDRFEYYTDIYIDTPDRVLFNSNKPK